MGYPSRKQTVRHKKLCRRARFLKLAKPLKSFSFCTCIAFSCPGASDNVTAALLPPTLESTESSGTTLAWDKQKQLIKYTSSTTVRLLRNVSTDGARETHAGAHSFLFPTPPDKTYYHLGRRSFWLFYATEKPYRTVKKVTFSRSSWRFPIKASSLPYPGYKGLQ